MQNKWGMLYWLEKKSLAMTTWEFFTWCMYLNIRFAVKQSPQQWLLTARQIPCKKDFYILNLQMGSHKWIMENRGKREPSKQQIPVSVRIHFVPVILSGIHLSKAHPAWPRQGTGWSLVPLQLSGAALQWNGEQAQILGSGELPMSVHRETAGTGGGGSRDTKSCRRMIDEPSPMVYCMPALGARVGLGLKAQGRALLKGNGSSSFQPNLAKVNPPKFGTWLWAICPGQGLHGVCAGEWSLWEPHPEPLGGHKHPQTEAQLGTAQLSPRSSGITRCCGFVQLSIRPSTRNWNQSPLPFTSPTQEL